jgi:hypothetical protein
MKTIIAGSRTIEDYTTVLDAVKQSGFTITEIVSGTARGVDRLGERYGEEHGIPIERFPADWDTHGKRAGYLRNETMINYADALIAIWDGISKGTNHAINLAKEKGLKVFIYKT